MREFLIILGFLLAMLTLAAALLPLLHDALPEIRPDRMFYRSAMLLAALALWPLARLLALRGRDSWGYGLPAPEFRRRLWQGWLAGVAILVALLAMELLAGVRTPAAGIAPGPLLKVILSGIVGGLLVGFIEETFFRGVIHSVMRRSLSFVTTAALTAALYASLHFTRPARLGADAPVYGDTGWQLFASMADAYAQPLLLVDSWIALFAVGVFLSLVRERTGSIALAIGLHAGWVAVIKTGRYLTETAPDAPLAFLIGSYDGVIGWLAAGWISLLAWLYARRYPARAA